MTLKITLILVGIVLGLTGALASIETNKPVPVTHRNSGPRYDIDDVEKTKLTSTGDNDNQQPPTSMSSNGASDDNSPSIGHLSIRRIFLVPMMPGPVHPPDSLWSQGSASERNHQQQDGLEREQPNHRTLLRPIFGGSSDPDHSTSEHRSNSPFQPMSFHHLFGQDSASRHENYSPKMRPPIGSDSPSSPEEEAARDRFQNAILDPIQMMIEMMQQALHQAQPAMKGDEPTSGSTDLNKEASGKPEQQENNNNNDKPFTGLDKALKPLNETKEDVVEIDGKKYLRKTVINRHVGENIIFMTKRLVFVPLNETDSTTTVATRELQPSTTTTTSQPPVDETPSTTTSTTTTTTTTTELPKIEEPTTTAPVSMISSEPTTTTTTTAQSIPDSSIIKDEKDKFPEETTTNKDVELTTLNPAVRIP